MSEQSTVVCAWCGNRLASVARLDTAAPVWYGMCETCATAHGGGMFPTQNMFTLSAADYDALPLGALQLGRDATVLAYNVAEGELTGNTPEDVIGRNFFTEIAPCTRVQTFEGVFRDMVEQGKTARHAFDFVFRFAGGERFVHIAMTYDASRERALILVQGAREESPADAGASA
jgi:photoactive yellow protein